MAITAAHVDESGGAIPAAVASVYGDRFDTLEVETTGCGGECTSLDRALEAVGTEFGHMVSAQLTLQIALLARLAEALGRPYEEVLHEVMEDLV
jgi:hypothetical protein